MAFRECAKPDRLWQQAEGGVHAAHIADTAWPPLGRNKEQLYSFRFYAELENPIWMKEK